MEAAVYADAAVRHSIGRIDGIELQRDIPAWDYEGTTMPEEMALITQNYKEMQQIMSNYVGIVRSNLRLERAKRRLEIIFKETEELYSKLTLSQDLCELQQHDRRGLPHNQACRGFAPEHRTALFDRLSAREVE